MKKRYIRLTALVLALLLTVQLAPATLAYGSCSGWAKATLEEIEQDNLLPESFAQADMTVGITRLELCRIVVQAYTVLTGRTPEPKRTDYFTDTKDADVCVAYELGIVKGVGGKQFAPNQGLTRQELFQFVYNLFASVGWSEDEIQEKLDGFSDASSIHSWARESTKLMLEIGVTNGTGGNQMSPLSDTSVEQALVMFLRAYQYIDDWLASFLPETGLESQTPEELTEHTYTNVSAWAESDVNTTEALGLVPACLYGEDFTRSITREEMCEVAVLAYQKITGDTHTPNSNYFSDTQNPNVNLAFECQIVSGCADGTFRPKNPITRQELFTMISNLLYAVGWEKFDNTYELLAQFSDSGSIASWAQAAALVSIELGVVQGNGAGSLMPTGTCTREQAAIMFYRGYRYIHLWYSEHPLDEDVYPGQVVVSSTATQLVELALKQVGKSYVYGAAGPNSFDCSGLVRWLYQQFGYSLNRVANDQWRNGVQVSRENMQPGDVVYFASSPGGSYIGHVGIYIGDGRFVHAANTKLGVIVSSLSESWYAARFYGARRIIY